MMMRILPMPTTTNRDSAFVVHPHTRCVKCTYVRTYVHPERQYTNICTTFSVAFQSRSWRNKASFEIHRPNPFLACRQWRKSVVEPTHVRLIIPFISILHTNLTKQQQYHDANGMADASNITILFCCCFHRLCSANKKKWPD